MPKAANTLTTRRRAAHASNGSMEMPLMPVPPKSAAEIAADKRILEDLHELIRLQKLRNLDCAVALAELARQGKLPAELQAHFAELGRRFCDLLNRSGAGPATSPTLRVIDGGAA